MLSTGFSALWKNVVDKDGLNVRLESPVVKIERLGEKTRVHYKQLQVGDSAEYEVGVTLAAGEPSWERLDTYTIEADLVVVRVNESVAATIPNRTVAVPFKPAMEANIFEPTQAEMDIFSSLKGQTFQTTLYSSAPPKDGLLCPEEMWLGPLQNYNGRLRAVRNSALSLYGRQLEARPRSIAYQAEDKPPSAARGRELRKILLRALKLTGLEDVQIEGEKNWDYFWHFSQEAIDDGAPWNLLNMQGDNRTIWAGSSACFESVLDVLQYDDLLFEILDLAIKS